MKINRILAVCLGLFLAATGAVAAPPVSQTTTKLAGTSVQYGPGTQPAGTYCRSNSGASMSDTLPNPSAVGNAFQLDIIDCDSVGSITITPPGGVSICNATNPISVPPGFTATIRSDGTAYQCSGNFLGTFNASSATVVATGSITARTLANRATDQINVLDYGAVAGTQKSTVAVSITAGTKDLTSATALWSNADVGKYIVVPRAGPSASTGSITSIPIVSGGLYGGLPSVALSGGGGSGEIHETLVGLASATVAAGGSGCPGSSVTGPLSGNLGVNGWQSAQVTLTVSGGVVTGVSSIGAPGLYYSLPSGPQFVSSTGCSVSPQVNLTGWTVVAAWLFNGGSGYSLTANAVTGSISGGSPVTPGSIGTIPVQPIVGALASTIASFVNSTHVVLADNAGTTVSAGTVGTAWGPDESAGIQAAINAACSRGGADVVFPTVPAATGYGIAAGLTYCSNGATVRLVGAVTSTGQNPQNASLYALQYMTEQVKLDSSNEGCGLSNIALDGMGVVQHNLNLRQGKHCSFDGDYWIRNAAPAGLTFQNGSVGPFTWSTTSNVIISTATGSPKPSSLEHLFGPGRIENELGEKVLADGPTYNIEVYSTDSRFLPGLELQGAYTAALWIPNGGNNAVENVHAFSGGSAFGSNQSLKETYCFYATGNVQIGPLNACDGAQYAFYVPFLFTGNGYTQVIGNRGYWTTGSNAAGQFYVVPPSNFYGVYLEPGVLNSVIMSNTFVFPYSPANVVFQASPGDASTIVINNPSASYTATPGPTFNTAAAFPSGGCPSPGVGIGPLGNGWYQDGSQLGACIAGSSTSLDISASAITAHVQVGLPYLAGQGTAPSVTAGTGAGTSPTIALDGNATNIGFILSLTTGGSPATNATVATVTFSSAFPHPPKCQFSSEDAHSPAAGMWQTVSTTAWALKSTTALSGATAYQIAVNCTVT